MTHSFLIYPKSCLHSQTTTLMNPYGWTHISTQTVSSPAYHQWYFLSSPHRFVVLTISWSCWHSKYHLEVSVTETSKLSSSDYLFSGRSFNHYLFLCTFPHSPAKIFRSTIMTNFQIPWIDFLFLPSIIFNKTKPLSDFSLTIFEKYHYILSVKHKGLFFLT